MYKDYENINFGIKFCQYMYKDYKNINFGIKFCQ